MDVEDYPLIGYSREKCDRYSESRIISAKRILLKFKQNFLSDSQEFVNAALSSYDIEQSLIKN